MGVRASIIIVNWNGRQYLERCLSAVASQTYSSYETILVDNASCDGSIELARRIYPDIRIVENERNRGFAAGNNDGIRIAQGEYIVTLNNDAIPKQNWLAELVAVADADDSVGMVASKMLFYDWPDIINSTGISLDLAAIAWDRLGGKPAECSETVPVEIFGPCAGAALYKKRMLDDIGLFDEDFFMYLEDVDLAWRARLRGWRCIYAPMAEVLHVHSASSIEGSCFKNRLLGRNKVWVVIKNYPNPHLLVFLPIILFYDMISLPYSVLVRGNVAALQGRLEGLRGIGTMLQRRRAIQQRRKASFRELARLMDSLSDPLTLFRRYHHLGTLIDQRRGQLSSRTNVGRD